MTRSIRLDVPLLLPDLPDSRDECVHRLAEIIGGHKGVERSHVVLAGEQTPRLCLHYDPAVIGLRQVEELARRAGAEVTRRYEHALIALRAVDGEDAARRIEDELEAIDGVAAAAVSMPAQRARVEYERDRTSIDAILAALRGMGYAAEVAEAAASGAAAGIIEKPGVRWIRRNPELALSLGAGALLALAWAAGRAGMAHPAVLLVFVASYVLGGYDLVRHWVTAVWKRRRFRFDIDLLMLLAAVGAAALSEWLEGAFLLFLFSLAHALEHFALGRARGAIRALADLAPPTARRVREGAVVEVPIAAIRPGDLVQVRPAERVPVDGRVHSGNSAVNQAPITGESAPVEKAAGDAVFAGSVNGEGVLEIETTVAVGDRTLDRVVRIVEEAQTQKAPTQRFTDRFERIFVPAVLLADLVLILAPPLAGWLPWSESFYRAMALLVAASPCALALGTPAAVLAGIAQAARNGVLVKGGAHIENLGALRAIAFDKTGTLTTGRPEVSDVVAADGVAPSELVRVAASLERASQHPLAEAVVRRAETDGLAIPVAANFLSVTGRGVRATLDGDAAEAGSTALWADGSVRVPPPVAEAASRLQGQGRSVVVVRRGDRWLGVIGISDQPRPEARDVVARLRGLGLGPLVMLSGDNPGAAEAVCREVGVDECRAGLLPADKLEEVRALLARHGSVAMVGDGINDAPALAHATVGIAMGGAGTAAALETADVALMADDLARLPFAIGLSRATRRVIRQNLYVSLGVIALLVLTTTIGRFGIGAAVIVHEGSTLVVIGNALRLLRYRLRL